MHESKRERDPFLYQSIGMKISKYRKTRSINQQELADKCGLTRPSIVHIEKGRQLLPIDRLYRIAEVLEVSALDLLPEQNTSNKGIDPASRSIVSDEVKKTLSQIISKYKGEQ